MSPRKWSLALVLVVLVAVTPVGAESSPADELGRTTALVGGRLMPLDSLARQALFQLSGRRTYEDEDAIVWLARALFTPGATLDDEVFLVNHPGALDALGLGEGERGRYAFRDLMPGMSRLQQLAQEVSLRPGGEVDRLEAELLRLLQSVGLYSRVVGAMDFARPHPDFTVELEAVAAALGLPGIGVYSLGEIATRRGSLDSPETAITLAEQSRLLELAAHIDGRQAQSLANPIKLIPGGGTWLSPEGALLAGVSDSLTEQLEALVIGWGTASTAENTRRLADFNGAVAVVARGEQTYRPPGIELIYNRARPFFYSAILALVGLLFHLVGLKRLRWIGGALLATATSVHTVGLAMRMIITRRPPVTSLYTSFLFVAWFIFIFGLYLHYRKKHALGLPVGLAGGFLITLLSAKFAAEGDQLGVLQAVLDTNFWLSTHVVTITIGYAGSIVAGLLGHVYLVRKVARPSAESALRSIHRLTYGVLIFSLIFTFVGTVLGGIWADQSWGRFWGWDPKENGALLIVLWISALLHARLARLIDHQGMAAGSVLLVLVVLFSWLGVNLMGVGLHSYGWTQGVGMILFLVAGGEILFLLVTSLLARVREKPSLDLRTCRVKEVVRETPDTVTLRLATAPGERLEYRPGMYATVYTRIDGITYRRPYSFSSISRNGDPFAITVKRVDQGVVSNWLVDQAKPGSRLVIGGPSGEFGLEAAANGGTADTYPVFVAGGSGIAPLLPMAEDYLERGGENLLLIYGNRGPEDIIFGRRLDDLVARYPGFRLRHYLADPPKEWTGGVGRVSGETVLAEVADLPKAAFYLCGPDQLVEDVRDALVGAGVDRERIAEEKFLPAASGAARRASKGADVAFRLSDREVKVHSGQSILEAGLQAGLPIRYSCAAGRCRDCAARILQGSVAMDEPNVLTSAEKDRGVILTCVAYPESNAEIDL